MIFMHSHFYIILCEAVVHLPYYIENSNINIVCYIICDILNCRVPEQHP